MGIEKQVTFGSDSGVGLAVLVGASFRNFVTVPQYPSPFINATSSGSVGFQSMLKITNVEKIFVTFARSINFCQTILKGGQIKC